MEQNSRGFPDFLPLKYNLRAFLPPETIFQKRMEPGGANVSSPGDFISESCFRLFMLKVSRGENTSCRRDNVSQPVK